MRVQLREEINKQKLGVWVKPKQALTGFPPKIVRLGVFAESKGVQPQEQRSHWIGWPTTCAIKWTHVALDQAGSAYILGASLMLTTLGVMTRMSLVNYLLITVVILLTYTRNVNVLINHEGSNQTEMYLSMKVSDRQPNFE